MLELSTCSIASYDKTILEKDITFCLEPAIWIEDGFYVTEQDVAVTENGCEILSKAADALYDPVRPDYGVDPWLL